MLAASFSNFPTYHSYPLLRLEVLISPAGLAVIAALFGLLHAGASQFWALLDGLAGVYGGQPEQRIRYCSGLAALALAFARLARDISLHAILAIISGVVLLEPDRAVGKPRR